MEGMLLLAVPLEDRGVVPEATADLLIPVRLFHFIIETSADDQEKEVRQMEVVSMRSTTGESCFLEDLKERRKGC